MCTNLVTTDILLDHAETTAASIGADHGRAAGTWVTDGNTDNATYWRILDGLDKGDPEVLDRLPSAPLSGEWADGYLLSDLSADVGVAETVDGFDDLATAYEMAWSDAMTTEVERACREALGAETDANYCRAHDLFGCPFAH